MCQAVLSHLILTTISDKFYLIESFPFYRCENWELIYPKLYNLQLAGEVYLSNLDLLNVQSLPSF